jgi:hypothetical protein
MEYQYRGREKSDADLSLKPHTVVVAQSNKITLSDFVACLSFFTYTLRVSILHVLQGHGGVTFAHCIHS